VADEPIAPHRTSASNLTAERNDPRVDEALEGADAAAKSADPASGL